MGDDIVPRREGGCTGLAKASQLSGQVAEKDARLLFCAGLRNTLV